MKKERPELPPVLKWAGGKRWLLETIRPYVDPNRRLVDPFSGGLALPLGLRPERALLSDANPHLMNLYRWMRHGLDWDDSTGIDWVYDKAVFYENREKFNALCEARQYWTREGALLFYYLNRTCYNGLCRFNSSGFFNSPFGAHKSVELRRDFYAYRDVFEGWDLYFGDFSTLPVQPDDLIYADPPYDVDFTQFTPKDFTWDDQVRLAKWLGSHPGPVIASNSYTPRIVDLYRGLNFSVYTIPAPRSISCTGDRDPEIEILSFKGAAP